MIDRTRHIRRPQPGLDKGDWLIRCDCGWEGRTGPLAGAKVKSGAEVEAELEAAFVGHLAANERELYVLIDNRMVEVPEDPENDASPLVKVVRGTFVMPVGTPCKLTGASERDGVHWARFLLPDTGRTGELPVGEIRTDRGKVWRLDAPA